MHIFMIGMLRQSEWCLHWARAKLRQPVNRSRAWNGQCRGRDHAGDSRSHPWKLP